MSIESMVRALETPELPPAEKLVLIGIANHDGDGGAWPSNATLCRYTGLKERQVRALIGKLEERGLVTRHINEGGTAKTAGDRRPNLYTLHLATGGTPAPPVDSTGGSAEPPAGGTTAPDGGQCSAPEPSYNRPIEPSNTPLPPKGVSLEAIDDWNLFWDRYPRKTGKPAALRAWCAIVKRGIHSAYVLSGESAWTAHWREARTEPQFIPHPATWLNQERFNDTPPPIQRVGRSASALSYLDRIVNES